MQTEQELNILVVDNQYKQFKNIISLFKNEGYKNVFPECTESEFIELIDNVKVWINEQYNSAYRTYAIENIMNYIKMHKIDLIIMDYKLGGAYDSLTGIDLAMKINKHNNLEIPVIFLSRTPQPEEKRQRKYEDYKMEFHRHLWVHKGYLGLKMDRGFFKKYIFDKIDEFKLITIINLAKEILNSGNFGTLVGKGVQGRLKTIIETIEKNKDFSLPNDLRKELYEKLQLMRDKKDVINECVFPEELTKRIIRHYEQIKK